MQLEARPVCSGDGCIQTQLERSARVCLSSLCPHRQVHLESMRIEHHSVGDPLSGGHRLCSQFSWIWQWITHYASHETGSHIGPPQQTTPTGRPREPSASHLESVRGHLSAAVEISQKAAELLSSRWSQGTNVVYQSALKQ